MGVAEGTRETLAAKFVAIFPHLDERQRRLLMGAEARALGHGGIRVVARAAGVREATVSLGVGELDSGAAPLGRARKPGGGRKRLADLDPGLRPALLALVEPDERGDPMSPLRWTTKSLRVLAAELTRQGHRAGADTVADLLHEEGFSLQGNAKALEGKQSPDRDAQFRYLREQARDHQDAGEPVISVDTKKKELVGAYCNGGREWRPAGDPVRVNDHDFPDAELGKAIPYGVYDLAANTGWVNVGTDHDTAQFAAESIRRWWNDAGRAAYPRARRLLITADSGGSNSIRTRAWKTGLAALALETGLEITACHFPPGTQCRCLSTANYRGMECEHLGGHPTGRAAGLACRAEGVLRGGTLEVPVGLPQAPDAVVELAAHFRGHRRHELPDLRGCLCALTDDAASHVLEDLDEGDAVRVDPLLGGQPHDDPGHAVVHCEMRPCLLAHQLRVR